MSIKTKWTRKASVIAVAAMLSVGVSTPAHANADFVSAASDPIQIAPLANVNILPCVALGMYQTLVLIRNYCSHTVSFSVVFNPPSGPSVNATGQILPEGQRGVNFGGRLASVTVR